MATGFGFCANCGTPAGAPDEKFCASCGAAMPVNAAAQAGAAGAGAVGSAAPIAAAPPPAPTPPPWATAPTPPPYTPAPTPPPYGQPYAPGQPAWGTPPMGPMGPMGARPRTAVNPILVVAGLVVIVAIIGVGAFALANNKGSGAPGSLVFSPSTVSCDDTLTITTTLPSSVKESDPITLKVDGTAGGTHTAVEAGLTKQANGSWSGTASGPVDCTMGKGSHTEQLVDASGKVLAEGSFTITGTAASEPAVTTPKSTDTPAPVASAKTTPKATSKPAVTPPPSTAGSITVDPDSFSCSAAPVQVTMTFSLPASLSSDSEITAVIDGSQGETGTVGDNFDQQADGSWLSTETDTSTTLCSDYDTGKHTLGFLDASGSTIAEGSFTVNP